MMVAQQTDSGSLPKYAAVSAELEQDIVKGVYRLGDRLPSERQFAEHYGITPVTVRQALAVLQRKGLIVREQGRGTFVRSLSPTTHVPKAATRNVYLMGLDSEVCAANDPVNWQTRLRRFQGIVDASFDAGVRLISRVKLLPDAPTEQILNRFADAAGILLHEELLPESAIVALRLRGVPVVAMNCYGASNCCSRIQVDGRDGARQAISHLYELGHRRIAIIVGKLDRASMRQRYDGYRDAHEIYGLSIDDSLTVIDSRGLAQDGAAAIRELMAGPRPPTAVFCASDNRALGVLSEAERMGLQVPEKLSVVGFDNIHESAASSPSLSTVANPLYESGRKAVDLLLNQMREQDSNIQVRILPMQLVSRASCAAVPQ